MARQYIFLVLALPVLSACAQGGMAGGDAMALPENLRGKAVLLSPDDPAYGRSGLASAVQPEGKGGISAGLVVRLTTDISAYRLWSGPDALNSQGQTNRLGQWWSYDRPSGTRQEYRVHYEVCTDWNKLTWVASCTLKTGSIVTIGPGQSVSAATCANGDEQYPANANHWQTYVDKAWARPTELICPPASQDYQNDSDDITPPSTPGGA